MKKNSSKIKHFGGGRLWCAMASWCALPVVLRAPTASSTTSADFNRRTQRRSWDATGIPLSLCLCRLCLVMSLSWFFLTVLEPAHFMLSNDLGWYSFMFFSHFLLFFLGGGDGPAYTKSTLAGNPKASDPDDTSLQRYATHIAAWIAAALPDSVKSLAVKLLVRYLANMVIFRSYVKLPEGNLYRFGSEEQWINLGNTLDSQHLRNMMTYQSWKHHIPKQTHYKRSWFKFVSTWKAWSHCRGWAWGVFWYQFVRELARGACDN